MKEVFSITKQRGKQILTILFIIYIILLFYVTFFAWNYGASLGPQGPGGRNYNLIPFRSIFRISVYSPDIMDPIRILLGNVVLFLPLGFLLPIVFNTFKKSLLRIVFAGMALSIFIEVNQFSFTYRVANVDDVILNTLGAFLGGITYFVIYFIFKRVIFFNTKIPNK